MREIPVLDEKEIQVLCERAKNIIMAHPAPLIRLARDIESIREFGTQGGPTTPQFDLLCASPPFVAMSAQIVERFVRHFGHGLFRPPFSFLLLALAATGPIAAAQTLVLRGAPIHRHDPLHALIRGLEAVFASHPEALPIPVRKVLAPYMLNPPSSAGTA
jgi:hypothetical protein